MNRTLVQALVILVAGGVLGLSVNRLSARGLPVITPAPQMPAAVDIISLEQAEKLWHGGNALFLDAREPADYRRGHIGNALNLPAQSFAQQYGELAPILASDTELIVYCDGLECDLSHRLAKSLRERGHTRLHLLINGWTAWHSAGLPSTLEKQK
jgi:rhodanese-related sulfurtransferase